jgi:hypothetical protein
MLLDVPNSKYCFTFGPDTWGQLSMGGQSNSCPEGISPVLESASQADVVGWTSSCLLDIPTLMAKYPDLFSAVLVTAKCDAFDSN